MRDYRIFRLDRSGHINGPAEIYPAASDKAAISFAAGLGHENEAEVWQGSRHVAVVARSKPPAKNGG